MLAVVQARALLLAVVGALTVEQQALGEKVVALNKQALDEIAEEAFLSAHKHLLEAVGLAKKRGERDPMLARTFIHLGALTVMEGGPRKQAITYFKQALEIQPDIPVTAILARGDVMQVFREAKSPGAQLPTCPPSEPLRCPWTEGDDDPELPRRITGLDCPNRDTVQEAVPMVLRCAEDPALKVERATVYYRKSPTAKFKAWEMRRNARGWWTATIPADQISGPSAFYYVVGKGAANRSVASHGSAESPNVVLFSRPEACRCERDRFNEKESPLEARPSPRSSPTQMR
jgi:tetratricopeptide (TPR) repeat protein